MIKKILGIVVIVAVLAVIVASFGSSDTKNSNSTSTLKQQNVAINTNNGINTNKDDYTTVKNSQTNLSPAEAQKIANKYIQEPGAEAGTPKLMKQNGQMVYIVPVLINGNQVGEIYIDAQTGHNLGGAGGAP